MAEQNAHIDYELITKYLANEASDAEKKKVEEWLHSSEENRHVFFQLKNLWDETGRIIPHEEAEADVDDAWSKFKSKTHEVHIRPIEGSSETKSRNIFFYITRVAAVLLVGFIFYFLVNKYSDKNRPSIQISANQEMITDTLSDGTLVALNARSKLSYFKYSDKREVSLSGEAYFDVVSDSTKPFVIQTDHMIVAVIGTKFYVNAYDSLDVIKVGVESGKVSVTYAQTGLEYILEKGESLTINTTVKNVEEQTYEPNEIYWKTKTLVFQNEPLSDVFGTLEKTFNIEINSENQNILDCRLTAKFQEEEIETIFEIINTNFNLSTTNEEGQFFVNGIGCQPN